MANYAHRNAAKLHALLHVSQRQSGLMKSAATFGTCFAIFQIDKHNADLDEEEEEVYACSHGQKEGPWQCFYKKFVWFNLETSGIVHICRMLSSFLFVREAPQN